ncbi:hypothetical protein D3C71_1063220 [compost metagenome]
MVANAAELVSTGEAADDHPVANAHVARQCGVVGEHAVVGDMAVVRDVGIRQHPVVIADGGHATTARRATAERDELTEHIAVANHQLGTLTGELLVLRLATNSDVADETVLTADAGRAADAAMRTYFGAITNLDVGADQGERTHAHAFAQLGRRIDDCGRVDQRGAIAHGLVPA